MAFRCKLNDRAIELVGRDQTYQQALIDTVNGKRPDGPVQCRARTPDDGNRAAGSPGGHSLPVLTPREQSIAGHDEPIKEHDLTTPEGLFESWKAGKLDLQQYRNRLRALQVAADEASDTQGTDDVDHSGDEVLDELDELQDAADENTDAIDELDEADETDEADESDESDEADEADEDEAVEDARKTPKRKKAAVTDRRIVRVSLIRDERGTR